MPGSVLAGVLPGRERSDRPGGLERGAITATGGAGADREFMES
ncbi:MAG TPA: hypothetical protein PLN32_01970 [Methanoregulaceae archaeon]|nr:hypothetical protein [Methanoregulaceae archaeon]